MIALGCDHGGYELMQEVKKHLEERGLEYKDFGCNGPESVDYPVYGTRQSGRSARSCRSRPSQSSE